MAQGGNGVETVIDYLLVNRAANKENLSFWLNEYVDISDHVMIGIMRKFFRVDKKQEKEKEVEIFKWNLKKAQWSESRQDLNTTMEEEYIRGRTVNEWERNMKKKILEK